MGVKSLKELVSAEARDIPSERSVSKLEALLTGIAQGGTFNFADEIAASSRLAEQRDLPLSQQTIHSPQEAKALYDEQLQAGRNLTTASQAQHPLMTAGGNLIGGAIVSPAFGKIAGTPQNLPQSIEAGARVGGASGALSGLGEGEGVWDRLKRAGTGGTLGALVGAVTGGVFGLASPKSPAPTPEAIKEQSQAAYKVMDSAGVRMPKSTAEKLAQDIRAAVEKAGYDTDVHSGTESAIRSIEKLAKKPDFSFSELDLKRQLLRDVVMGSDAKERRVAKIAIQALDRFALGLQPQDIVAGDVKTANEAIGLARKLWGRYSKSETIQELLDIADVNAGQFSVSGKENALRNGFKGLYKSLIRDKAERSLYSDDELNAIKQVATGGGKISIENALRLLGKASVRGPVSALPTVSAYALGGPAGAATVAGLGELGRLGAEGMTSSNARLAAQLIARGSPSPLNLSAAALASEAALGSQSERELARMLRGKQ